MSKTVDGRLKEIYQINNLQQRDQWVNNLHPLVKFSLTVIFVVFVMSLDKYELSKAISFAVFPFLLYNLADLRLKEALYRMRLILPLVIAVGIFNPILDRTVITYVGGVPVTSGEVSMITLMLKGFYAVLSAYALIATTSIEDICYALRLLKVPKVLVTVILLIYRYLFILVEEAGRIFAAYSLRAPSQKGFEYKTWGPIIGQWLLRSMDKAEKVYESMCLRGFNGEFIYSARRKAEKKDYLVWIASVALFTILRFTDVTLVVGRLFMR